MITVSFILAAYTAIIALIHTFAGGRAIAKPLISDQRIEPAVVWTMYACWHIVTLLLFMIAIAHLVLALSSNAYPGLAWMLTALHTSFVLVFVAIGIRCKGLISITPQWTLFLPSTIASLIVSMSLP
ncbi:MAG: hypothetical protein JJ974_02710 [Phycisphaerales bacterium]|nr:hypothetical protein [Phycisphaerales bacterium]